MYGYANLHLFSSYREAYNKMQILLFRNIILNILLFVPYGFLLPIYSNKLKKGYKIILIGFLTTLIIEIIQYITKIGIFEIDDILNNTIGVLIGYCIFKIYYNLKNKMWPNRLGAIWPSEGLRSALLNNRKCNFLLFNKYIGIYFAPIIILIIFFAGIYFEYQKQEFENLSFNYNYKINMKNINIKNNINLKNEKTNKNIYYKKILTENETRKIAENIFEKINNKEIISEEEAYNKILDGKFGYAEYYFGKIKELEINGVNIEYELDTKGYYVPYFSFDVKINEKDTKIQIPALED